MIDSMGLRRTRLGRKLIAALNVIGRRVARLVYLRRKTPFLVDGHKVFLSDGHAPSLAFVGAVLQDQYEPEVRGLLVSIIRPGMVVLDVGAHIGHYTLLAARLVGPSGHVYAFEAEPENYAILTKNVELNGYTNVTCIPKAVSDRTGTLTLYVDPQGNDRHSIIEDSQAPIHLTKCVVSTVTLDEYASSEGWPRIDVIKMDIEGAEPLALAGMSAILNRSDLIHLLIEFAPEILRRSGTGPLELLTQLRRLGFTISVVEQDMTGDVPNEPSSLWISEIEKRGAINLLCRKAPEASPMNLGMTQQQEL